ncbi:MAG: MFS transporter [Flavobacteriia bacterium]|nr:MFS transporter [Flavobacteriia bacterium]
MEHLLKHRSLSALQFSEFRYYIIARFFFIMVLTMQATLIGWEVFAITRDPFSIGLIGLVEFVPAVVMAIYSGYIIDRTDKKRLLHWSIAGNLALTVLFTYITSKHALETFDRTFILISIYCIAFLTGVARAFSGPTSFALVSALIPKEHLPNAISWHSSSWQIAAVSGPAIGGLLYGEAGITFAFGIMTKRSLISPKVVYLTLLSPVICYGLKFYSADLFGAYQFGNEMLILNGLITFTLLFFLSKTTPHAIAN